MPFDVRCMPSPSLAPLAYPRVPAMCWQSWRPRQLPACSRASHSTAITPGRQLGRRPAGTPASPSALTALRRACCPSRSRWDRRLASQGWWARGVIAHQLLWRTREPCPSSSVPAHMTRAHPSLPACAPPGGGGARDGATLLAPAAGAAGGGARPRPLSGRAVCHTHAICAGDSQRHRALTLHAGCRSCRPCAWVWATSGNGV